MSETKFTLNDISKTALAAIIVGNGKNSRSPEVGKNTLTV